MTRLRYVLPFLSLSLLAACAMGPDYQRPSIDVPASYKEDYGAWRRATPQDETDRGAWWSFYKDPALNDLEKQVEISNQNLKAAEATWSEASAVVEESLASLFPTVAVNATSGRKVGTMPTLTATNSLYGSASWTPDVWGRIRRGVESDQAKAHASAADLASAKLAMQATLATDYFDLRAQDELKRLFDRATEVDTKALRIAQGQYTSGAGALADVLAAQTQLENVQAQSMNAAVRRAQLEHALAVLVGKPPAEFSLQPKFTIDPAPEVPLGLPSALLERRPDIASAERLVAASNAQIGVAQAAWFPNLTLSSSAGYAGEALSKLLQTSNSFWAVGPALAEAIFDGGAREARAKQASADYDRSVANYRQTVLAAFQQVEDGLASMRILAEERATQEAAVAHARAVEKLALSQYKRGVAPYADVLTAQSAELTNEQALLMTRQSRMDASVALIQALGGGWSGDEFSSGHD